MPIRRILVPLDGTAFAERALPLAERLARPAGASLVLVRVDTPVSAVTGLDVVAAPLVLNADDVRRADAAYLAGVAERLRAAGGEVRTAVLDGDVAGALRDACAREGVDLIVMTSHARGGLARLLLGSTAERVLHDGPGVPVLVARGQEGDAVGHEIARVAVVLDEDADTDATVGAALDVARPAGAALTLVMPHDPDRDRKATLLPTAVLAPGVQDADVALPDDAPDERAYLARVAHALTTEGVRADVLLVDGGAEEVARAVADAQADLVAVGAGGRRGLADALRHAVDVPVLVVPGAARGA
jgi:nucleotide-binding universal stress UspA family protein